MVTLFKQGFSLAHIHSQLEASCGEGAVRSYLKFIGLTRNVRQGNSDVFRIINCEACKAEVTVKGPRKFCETCIPNRPWLQRYRLYGLTKPQVEILFIEQDGLCAMCFIEIDILTCHVDHCHDQGHVRGLLCGRCNNALGYLDDDKLVAMAFRYLERNKR